MKKNLCLFLILIFINTNSIGQVDSTYNGIYNVIHLDSFVVVAAKKGFDVHDFIEMVKTDETFYTAFRNLRSFNYSFSNDITFFDKRDKIKALYQSNCKQLYNNTCREMLCQNETIEGNYYKKRKKTRYYTSKMYERLFFTKGKICGEENPKETIRDKEESGMEKHVNELKKLIFSPGEKANIPLIGQKTAIFEEDMMAYYDYAILSKKYKGIDCYVFKVKVKPKFQTKKQGKTIIKYLETYFEKSNLQVLARNYELAYSTAAFDFDVKMHIGLGKYNEKYIPIFIEYDGNWDIPFKKREISHFKIKFSAFK